MKKYSILSLVLIFLFSCKKDTQDGMPAYIHIDDITLNTNVDEGAATEKIIDAWVYINKNLQGIYELPAHFPVLKQGQQDISIYGGIRVNGIATSRARYPFYESYNITELLQQASTTVITPSISYFEWSSFFIEDFQGVGTNIDSTSSSEINFSIISDSTGEKYAEAILNDPFLTFEVATDKFENLPKAGSPVFLELDYTCNTEILVGVYVKESAVPIPLVWVTPKENWNKIYINLTPTVSEFYDASSFKFFISMRRPDSLEQAKVQFDNLKIVY